MENPAYPPHLTLVISDGPVPDGLGWTLRRDFAGSAPCRITFDAICRFPTAPHVLWLRPDEQTQLHDLHATACSVVAPDRCDPLYLPAQWQPHCTLATGVLPDREAEARRLICAPFAPLEVLFDWIELVSLPSVDVIASVALTAGASRK